MDKYFSSQQDDEQVIKVIRKHWIELLSSFFAAGIIYIFGIIAIFVLPVVFPVLVKGFAYNIYVIVISLLFLYNTAFLFSVWLIHYLNVGLITNEHIVEIVQESLFHRKISQLGLDKIQDVSASQKGMTETMFNFGNVDVQTAGELPNFLFHNIPNPNEVSQMIMEVEENYSNRHGLRSNGTQTYPSANQVNADQAEQNLPQDPEVNIEFPHE